MKLEPGTPQVDLHQRFREELRTQRIQGKVSLEGNPMQIAVAAELLARHAPEVQLADDGVPIRLMSLEAYGAAFLAAFMEKADPPRGPLLLHTIPEELLIAYAQAKSIPVVREEIDDVRAMLDRIAAQQPQTYFSLARSAERLAEQAQALRDRKRK